MALAIPSTWAYAERAVSGHGYRETVFVPNARRVLVSLAAVAVFAVLLLPAGSAYAATIPAVPNTPPQDGVIGDGICSLREAVRNANADAQVSTDCLGGAGNDTITLVAGTYNLSVPQAAEPNDAAGDLDLTDADGLTIQGAGAASTIVDAGGFDRAFDVRAGPVNITGLTIRDGANPWNEAGIPGLGGGVV